MKVIVSHENLDFDGIASMIACSKLNPEATVVFSGRINNDVKKFHSLYKNILPIKSANEIDLAGIKELIIVDVNSSKRIGKFKEVVNQEIPITIYDHHKETEDTIAKAHKIMKPYGSCTAILVELIKEKNIPITSFEATLFVVGIYTDTNCLTFSSTKSQDAAAVAYLLEKGADLEIVNSFIQTSFGNEHDQLFLDLILNMETIEVNNYRIILSVYENDHFIGELGYIAGKMLEIKNCDAVFLLVRMENRCYLVGRSLKDDINVPYILEEFNGKGHDKAASAVVKNGEVEVLKEGLLEALHKKIKPQIIARDIMNYPVKTVFEDMNIEEVSKIMLRYGHTGMPVIKENEIIGIISRTDVDKAMQHGLGHAPVKGFMTREVKTISPTTSLSEINDLLVRNNIGRLPVIEDHKVIGIVTRTDLLRMLHGNNHPYWYKQNFNEKETEIKCLDRMKHLPEETYDFLELVGKIGDTLDKKVYVVGGFVRDLLLKRDNDDIDIVVEGDGVLFAEELNQELKGKLLTHEEFGTASIKLQNNNTIDIVSARREYYEYPAALPKVEKSSLWNDLFRRDFTINCMAIQLNSESFGKLIDYFGGLQDLKNRKIRVLYNLSFIEDPTRILRAIRFSARMGFSIENETKNFIMEAIRDQMITKVSDDRIREEISPMLEDENFIKYVITMQTFNLFEAIDTDLKVTKETMRKLGGIQETMDEFGKLSSQQPDIKRIIITQIFRDFPINRLYDILGKFVVNKLLADNIYYTLEAKEDLYQLLTTEDLDRFTLYNTLSQHSLEDLVFYYNDCEEAYIKHYITYYMLHLKNIKLSMSGEDLLKLNIKPGPIYKKVLEGVLKAKISGEIYTKSDEIDYAYGLYKEMKGEENV
ncbi:tRNA nucleotidyltransferase/poly(A) polymerase [Clostridium aceticum]|uniref:tRNA nucleotidyltransferase/poly(A) polymerase n=1 Tax=Clostridium aceticum TaxID=84022 RepID=A0A0D8IDV2_9CLOT|nr:CBS domain-containing protein [Clostridium aceticum]AKL95327.1 tRNA nucleotidyltransferase/poly(A) polymerase [Clostridium aceticum]KJF28167.1 hypothetical protein TZ02_06415 [Clostridium aceticum]